MSKGISKNLTTWIGDETKMNYKTADNEHILKEFVLCPQRSKPSRVGEQSFDEWN